MYECFSSSMGECGAEAGNIAEVEKGNFGDVVDVGLEREGGI